MKKLLALALFLICGLAYAGQGMAPAPGTVHSTGGGGGPFTLGAGPTDGAAMASPGTVVITGTTAGCSLIVGARWDTPAANISSVTVSGESNATVRGTKATSGSAPDGACQFASLHSLTTGGSHTVTANMSTSTGIELVAIEICGGTMTFDTAGNGAGTGANASINLTTAADDDFVIGIKLDVTSTGTSGSGYTTITLNELAYNDVGEYNLAAGTAGTEAVNWTSTAGAWMICAMAGKH